MNRVLQILAFMGAMLPFLVQGQTVTFDAQVRPRAEFRNGFKALSPDELDPAFFIEQRTRLNTTYSSEKIKFKISFQDVRIWGATDQIYKSDPSLTNIFEAWGQYYFTPEFSFKVGRMPIAYHNERFMGALGWAAQGRSHDAAQFIYEKEGLKVDLGLAYNQDVNNPYEPKKITGTYYVANNYKTMQYLFLSKKLEKTTITGIFHNDGRQLHFGDSSTVYRQTMGLTLDQKTSGGLKFGAEFYYQMGKDQSDTDVSAFLLSAYATLSTDITPITLAMDYASGTDNGSTENNAWNPLYGTNHKFYGWMDYFYVGNPHKNVGLIDMRILTKFKTGEKSNLQARAHYFMSAADVVDATDLTKDYSNSLGMELDLVMSWKLDKALSVNLGYSQMFATESMEVIKGGDASSMNNWAWLQVNFTPQLIKWEMNKTE
ncbi:MAG: alginate export family protein [Reichenbachiella sp.]